MSAALETQSLNHDDMIEAALSSVSNSPVCMLPVDDLLTDESPRQAGTSPEHVRVLAQVAEPLPPIVVHRETMQVIDGAHRLHAARAMDSSQIAVRFFEGDRHTAFMLAVRFNVEHGLPLSLADRTAAAERILHANPMLSDRAIATTVGLSAVTIGAIRQRSANEAIQSSVRLGLDGKVRPLSSAEGRRRASSLIEETPAMPLREVARRSGISLATACDVRKRVLRGDDPVPFRQQEAGRRQPGPGRGAEDVLDTREREEIVRSLSRDPSLRYTDSGRSMLSWLSTYVLGIDRGRQLVGALPGHCLEQVAEVARGCEEEWRALAGELERRQRMQDCLPGESA